jgi:hypothetical protein
MRIVGEIPHPICKITLYSWNNRYLIKLEYGLLEQTYKVNQFDLTGEADLYTIVDEQFVGQALNTFREMEKNLKVALDRA